RAEGPRGGAIAHRTLAGRLREVVDRLIEQTLLLRSAPGGRGKFVDPAVHADFVPSRLHDGRDHLRVQQGADRRNEERGRDLELVEEREDSGQPLLSTKVGSGQGGGRRLARGE